MVLPVMHRCYANPAGSKLLQKHDLELKQMHML